MNSELEKRLSELRAVAEEQGEPALHVALHMLHACYRNGTHKQFAKHCCAFGATKLSLDGLSVAEDTGKPVRVQ